MDYKGATGVRARDDLSPNPRREDVPPDLVKVATGLSQMVADAKRFGNRTIPLPIGLAERLVDALLLAEQKQAGGA